jgi:SSS family solute:Na+ symporter
MVFLGIFMMPFYYGSRARSVPEYLALRFDDKTRGLNAVAFAFMTIFSSGISLYALALLLKIILGWSFEFSVFMAAGVVLIYTFLGGLTSAVYNEVLQFFLIVLGIAPVVFVGLYEAGGWHGITDNLAPAMVHAWKYMGSADENPMGVNAWSMAMGLGFVMSFGYWCTDFLVVQRAMIARSMTSARRTPIIASFPKMMMPFIVILPGLIAMALTNAHSNFTLPLKSDGRTDFDMALPSLIAHYYPSGLLGVGITALLASFMSGMAGNVTAFNTVFTFDIYQAYIKKDGTDQHYLLIGKMATVFGIIASIGAAYLTAGFNNLNDFLQLVFSFVNAPLFATFLLGMFWKRTTGHGAFWGLLLGTLLAAVFHGLTLSEGNKGGWIGGPIYTFRSAMGQAFAVATVAWVGCFFITIFVSLFTKPRQEKDLVGLVYSLTPKLQDAKSPVMLAIIMLVLGLILNLILF